MKVFCAWCQKEGRVGLLKVVRSADPSAGDSHGICKSHQAVLLAELAQRRVERQEVARV